MGRYLFTSESVTPAHADKLCDQISDAVLDALYEKDPHSRVAVETLTTTGLIVVAGEVTTKAYIDVQSIVRDTVRDVGYDNPEYGFDADQCSVLVSLHEQSPDISQGVTEGQGQHIEQGAGDQGLMFGYATNETPEYMPLPIDLAHKLTYQLSKVRRNNTLPWVRPDGKSQVTVEYENGTPLRVDTVVISTQHSPDIADDELKREIIDKVISPVVGKWIDDKTTIHINPTGRFVIGGPPGDSGLTGRKIIVDTYGGHGSHGGGAFSGKDPSKVDRSASYMARHIAKNVVAAGLADRCEIQIAYAIGVAKPVSLLVNTYSTAKIPEERIKEIIEKNFDLRPAAIIDYLKLRRPIYKKTAAYGHFGRSDPDFTWEAINKAAELGAAAGIEPIQKETAPEQKVQEAQSHEPPAQEQPPEQRPVPVQATQQTLPDPTSPEPNPQATQQNLVHDPVDREYNKLDDKHEKHLRRNQPQGQDDSELDRTIEIPASFETGKGKFVTS